MYWILSGISLRHFQASRYKFCFIFLALSSSFTCYCISIQWRQTYMVMGKSWRFSEDTDYAILSLLLPTNLCFLTQEWQDMGNVFWIELLFYFLWLFWDNSSCRYSYRLHWCRRHLKFGNLQHLRLFTLEGHTWHGSGLTLGYLLSDHSNSIWEIVFFLKDGIWVQDKCLICYTFFVETSKIDILMVLEANG